MKKASSSEGISRRQFFKVVGVSSVGVFYSGCMGPRGIEWGHVPTGNFDPNPGNIAPFGSKLTSGNGIIYTVKAGTIDPDHIWGWGRYAFGAYSDISAGLFRGDAQINTTSMQVKIGSYPANWDVLSSEVKKLKVHELSMELAKTVAFHQSIYHELSTYWGFGLDYESSFSWEDMYSNAVGVTIAMNAQDLEFKGDGRAHVNITLLTQQFLNENEWVSPQKAAEINNSLEGKYWRNRPFQRKQLARNIDIGVDGYVDNTPLPGLTVKGMTRIPAPRMDYSDFMGFSIRVDVSPSISQYSRARAMLGLDRQITVLDHPRFMQLLKKDLESKGYLVFD